jgi:uncharacterized protein YabN with tetrapyrrole methylase and pyrophosphatase domain
MRHAALLTLEGIFNVEKVTHCNAHKMFMKKVHVFKNRV